MRKKATQEEIAGLSLELSLLLHAGVGTGEALSLLAEEWGGEALAVLAERVEAGAALSAALRESGAFPAYVCGLVETGERTGRTEQALAALSRYYEGRMRLGRQLKKAVLYPAVMLGLMLVVIGVLLVKVLPIFDSVYATLGSRLSGAAGGLLALGRWLERSMPALWTILALLAVAAAACAVCEPVRAVLLAVWHRRFGDRGVSRKLNDARLAQALAMGMAGGLPLEETLELCEGLLEGGARARCQECRRRLEGGERLSGALSGSGLLPPRSCRLLELGQRGGAGDRAMEKIAGDLMEEGEEALEAVAGRVEPALVLVCSLLVGLILLSVMLPLMNIMAAIG